MEGMPKNLSSEKHKMHTWILRFALLCFIVFHGLGLFHHHVTEAEHSVCVACQVAEHQALDVPDADLAPLFFLLVLLFLILPWHPKVSPRLGYFTRPQPRGPPLYLIS
jgi:hypothetical protein